MSDALLTSDPAILDDEWRRAVVEAQRAHQAYYAHLQQSDDDIMLGRLWLRLWRAERLRDEIFIAGS